MVGQQDPGVDGEWESVSGSSDAFAEGGADGIVGECGISVVRDDGEEKSTTRGLGSAVFGHGCVIGIILGAWDAPYRMLLSFGEFFPRGNDLLMRDGAVQHDTDVIRLSFP